MRASQVRGVFASPGPALVPITCSRLTRCPVPLAVQRIGSARCQAPAIGPIARPAAVAQQQRRSVQAFATVEVRGAIGRAAGAGPAAAAFCGHQPPPLLSRGSRQGRGGSGSGGLQQAGPWGCNWLRTQPLSQAAAAQPVVLAPVAETGMSWQGRQQRSRGSGGSNISRHWQTRAACAAALMHSNGEGALSMHSACCCQRSGGQLCQWPPAAAAAAAVRRDAADASMPVCCCCGLPVVAAVRARRLLRRARSSTWTQLSCRDRQQAAAQQRCGVRARARVRAATARTLRPGAAAVWQAGAHTHARHARTDTRRHNRVRAHVHAGR
jgi:hypothetical protein